MIMTLHTGVPGYKLALGEVQPVLNFLESRLEYRFRKVVLRDVGAHSGAPNMVVTADVTVPYGPTNEYGLVLAASGPIAHAEDVCTALSHLDAGRNNEPMCPRALKTINEFKSMAAATSAKPQFNMVWAIVVPDQQIYWLIAAVRDPHPGVLLYSLQESTPR